MSCAAQEREPLPDYDPPAETPAAARIHPAFDPSEGRRDSQGGFHPSVIAAGPLLLGARRRCRRRNALPALATCFTRELLSVSARLPARLLVTTTHPTLRPAGAPCCRLAEAANRPSSEPLLCCRAASVFRPPRVPAQPHPQAGHPRRQLWRVSAALGLLSITVVLFVCLYVGLCRSVVPLFSACSLPRLPRSRASPCSMGPCLPLPHTTTAPCCPAVCPFVLLLCVCALLPGPRRIYFNPVGGKPGILGKRVEVSHEEFPITWFEG